MELGLLTATAPSDDVETVARRASNVGFDSLELAAWPVEEQSTEQADTVFDPKKAASDEAYAESVVDTVGAHGLSISALAYYPNNLHPNEAVRAENHDHLKRVIQAASNMDLDLVGTFVGRDPSMPLDDAVDEAKRVWPELIEFAESHDVSVMIENCPMDHYGAYGTNLFYSPETWETLFTAIDSDYFGLNYDPSHMYWLGMDHIEPLERFSDRIFHAHAKDTQIHDSRRDEIGILADRSITDDHWWSYRIPGLGEIDWAEYIRTLYDIGFDGTLAIEHEDPTFEGSSEMFWKGAEIGYAELEPYVR
jgi:sugar phosphate isomerase/epimerase